MRITEKSRTVEKIKHSIDVHPMPEDNRKTGIKAVGDVAWGTHSCQFYQSKEDLLSILVPYFKAGLENNEFCMWVTAEPLGVDEAKKALSKALPNLEDYIKSDQVEIIPHTEWYLKSGSFDSQRVLNGWVDKLNKALEKGFDGLRLTGNTFWLEKENWRDFADYEDEVNKVIGNYKIIAICSYSMDKCGAAEVIDVVNTHQFALVKQAGEWNLIESSELKQTKEALKNERDKAREAEKEIWQSQNFLEIANRQTNFDPLLDEFVQEIKGLTGCKAVGIRLGDEFGNIPYASCSGFSDTFYKKESNLSAKSDECFCINVITGTADPARSFYTDYGSFYVKGTTKFLKSVSEKERGPIRGVCNKEGYESVALIPIRSNGGIIGLIHVADPRENMVSLQLVKIIERISKVLGVSIQRAQAHKELAKAYETEHKIAETLQRSLLTEEIPEIEDLEIEYFYQSATQGAAVGGDFYDFFKIPDKGFCLVVGDVSGKGILAAAETTKIKHLLRDRAYTGVEPPEAIAGVNDAILRQSPCKTIFTALTFGLYNPQTSVIKLTNAGNPYPYLVKKDRFLETTGTPVAVKAGEKYESIEVKLEKSDILLMYTDGLTEARHKGELFGEGRVRTFVKKNKNLPLNSLIKDLVEEARNFSQNNLTDDILVLALKKT